MLLFGSVGFALLAGDWPDRLAAAVFGLSPLAQSALYSITERQQFASVDWGLLVINLSVIISLLLIAYNAERFWWIARAAAMMTFAGVLAHLVRLVRPELLELSYVYFNSLPTLFAVGFVAISAAAFRLKVSRGDRDRPWCDYRTQDRIRKALQD